MSVADNDMIETLAAEVATLQAQITMLLDMLTDMAMENMAWRELAERELKARIMAERPRHFH